ncbi:unnamed protein product [Polarella glacialis]|uniref:Uncharacterized protein n=1 Tax=Polarella glacialis TaxID=89957 RepID=A0A813EC01_POLGL|nr:unnamed protein product [Polarella glacialis]
MAPDRCADGHSSSRLRRLRAAVTKRRLWNAAHALPADAMQTPPAAMNAFAQVFYPSTFIDYHVMNLVGLELLGCIRVACAMATSGQGMPEASDGADLTKEDRPSSSSGDAKTTEQSDIVKKINLDQGDEKMDDESQNTEITGERSEVQEEESVDADEIDSRSNDDEGGQHCNEEIDAKKHNMKADEQKGDAKDIDQQYADAQEIGKAAWDDEATDKQKVGRQGAVDGQDGGQADEESRIDRLLRTFVAEDSEDERLIRDMFASASDEEDEEYHKDHGEEAESEGLG